MSIKAVGGIRFKCRQCGHYQVILETKDFHKATEIVIKMGWMIDYSEGEEFCPKCVIDRTPKCTECGALTVHHDILSSEAGLVEQRKCLDCSAIIDLLAMPKIKIVDPDLHANEEWSRKPEPIIVPLAPDGPVIKL